MFPPQIEPAFEPQTKTKTQPRHLNQSPKQNLCTLQIYNGLVVSVTGEASRLVVSLRRTVFESLYVQRAASTAFRWNKKQRNHQ
ncbi:hypothetical protein LWI29_032691 [Acer saccharum]|uniref:Uncharacterized protein n=1 Tax=Acer saccharum TaxID=4024 RepID=A0AA39WAF7_ACESA|nr:hypothetical protein LWI29_032691 [Acer saccharum]